MKTTAKNSLKIITSLTFVLLLNGCVTKNADGSYPQTYSYQKSYNITPVNNRMNTKRATMNKNFIHTNVLSQPQRTMNIKMNRKSPTYSFNRTHSPRETSNYTSFLLNAIEENAKSHLGKAYEWAAVGPDNFDCSGFTQSVFSHNGIKLPRRAIEQSKVGKYISKNNLQKGDLIFFDSRKSSKISHVGIYLGNGKFIHASSGKNKVVIGRIDKGYHSKHFKWGRRLTPTCTLYAGR